MEAKLVVIIGKTAKRAVPLQLPTVIGRSSEADLTVGHPVVSRRHCEIFARGDILMVRDLGSLNGTTVGGRRVEHAPLPPDGEFMIGTLRFRVEYSYTGDLNKLPPIKYAAGEDEAEPVAETAEFQPLPPAKMSAHKPAKSPPPQRAPVFDSGDSSDSHEELPDFLRWSPQEEEEQRAVARPAELPTQSTPEGEDPRFVERRQGLSPPSMEEPLLDESFWPDIDAFLDHAASEGPAFHEAPMAAEPLPAASIEPAAAEEPEVAEELLAPAAEADLPPPLTPIALLPETVDLPPSVTGSASVPADVVAEPVKRLPPKRIPSKALPPRRRPPVDRSAASDDPAKRKEPGVQNEPREPPPQKDLDGFLGGLD
ncbi:MAG: FHA domain-containing protein, partial [Thermoguttaceae bacterium]|jgi:predicted component of type VI protein secretion system